MQKNIAHSTIVRVLDRLKQHVQVKKKFGDLKTSTPLVDATINETLWYFSPLGDCSLQ